MFEKLKDGMRQIKAPQEEANEPGSINSLIEQVQSRDLKDKKMFKGVYTLFIVMFILYTLIFVINPDPGLQLINRIAGGFFILSFGIMIPILQQNYYERKGVDYQTPTRIFLQRAENRLKFWNKKSWLIIPFLILISIGENLALFHSSWLAEITPINRLLLINLVYWGLMGIALLIARGKWKREKSHLLEQVQTLKMSFE